MDDGLNPNLGILRFAVTDDGSVSLVLTSPSPGKSSPIKPSIGVSRDKTGRFHFLMGNDQSVFEPAMLPTEIRKLLRAQPNSKDASMKLPPCGILKNEKGGFRTFQEYSHQQQKTDIPYREPLPKLTPDIYRLLVDSYQKGTYTCK